jgi:exonuclease 3'-5' domain-containing protein 2
MRKHMTRSRTTPLYGNCIIEAPDGQALCRTNQKKIQWYIDRNLGHLVNNEPLTLRLFREPTGRRGAEHPFTTSYKKNVCVVCGTDEEITRHHVVPKCFRRHFPVERKQHALHDVLILCINCHNRYEEHASKKKQKMADAAGVPSNGIGFRTDNNYNIIRNAAHALMEFWDRIPEIRRECLLDVLREHYGRREISKEDIANARQVMLIDPDYKSFGQYVVEHLEDLDIFIKDWRRHFVDTMNPKHLPSHWSVDNDLY